MELSRGFAMLKIENDLFGRKTAIYPSLFWDADEAILVDTGFPGNGAAVHAAIARHRGTFDRLSSIVITHQDIDHIGGGREIFRLLSRETRVFAHELDAPYIRGDKSLIKAATLGNEIAKGKRDDSDDEPNPSAPEGIPEEKKRAILAALRNPPSLSVSDVLVGSGPCVLPCGLRAFHTPGHTPGHISIFHEESGTFVAGDLFFAEEGHLRFPEPYLCSDFSRCAESVRVLRGLDIRRVICYHGGMVDTDVKRQLISLGM